MKLTLKLSANGIAELQKQLEEHSKSLETKTHELAKTLAEKGAVVVQNRYDTAQAEYGSPNAHSIEIDESKAHQTSLIANGKHIAFYEYGTGLYAGESYPDDYVAEGISTRPGSWSQSELGKKQFDYINHPWWRYKNNEYAGFPPSYGMYEASKEIRRNIDREAKRIFRND